MINVFAQLNPQQVAPDLIGKWTEPTSILAVMGILSLMLLYICFWLLKELIKSNNDSRDRTQNLILDIQKNHDLQTKELQDIIVQQALDTTKAITGVEHTLNSLLDRENSEVG